MPEEAEPDSWRQVLARVEKAEKIHKKAIAQNPAGVASVDATTPICTPVGDPRNHKDKRDCPFWLMGICTRFQACTMQHDPLKYGSRARNTRQIFEAGKRAMGLRDDSEETAEEEGQKPK